MGLLQPKVEPNAEASGLQGRAAIVTGASAGIGLETCRQLLLCGISTLIMGVRNTVKGQLCAQDLRDDASVRKRNPDAIIRVVQLELDSLASVKGFVEEVKKLSPYVNLVIINAGIAVLDFALTGDGQEQSMQVNYLSNALLVLELMQLLEAGADSSKKPSRITWVGSRMHHSSSIEKKAPISQDEAVLEHFNRKENFFPLQRYNDTKLLCALFMYQLAPSMDSSKVEINMLCPGMVNTSMSDFLPLPVRLIFNLVKAVRARTVQQAGWIVMNAAIVVGPESHGRFMADKIVEEKAAFIQSSAGQSIQKRVWEETVALKKSLSTNLTSTVDASG